MVTFVVEMEKRKKSHLDVAAKTSETLGPTKKVFKTRPLTKKKAQRLKAEGGDNKPIVAVVDRTAIQWRPRAEQAEWFTSSFLSVFGPLLSPAEKEPLPGLLHYQNNPHLFVFSSQGVVCKLQQNSTPLCSRSKLLIVFPKSSFRV